MGREEREKQGASIVMGVEYGEVGLLSGVLFWRGGEGWGGGMLLPSQSNFRADVG